MKGSNGSTEELRLLRLSVARAGLLPRSGNATDLPDFETPESLIVRLQARDARPVVPPPRRRSTRKRILVGFATVACAAMLVTGIAQPWKSPVAAASTPAVLDFKFADAQSIGTAPGRPAAALLKKLAKTASAADISQGAGKYQRVVTDNWFSSGESTEAGSKSVLVPQVNETYIYPDGRFRLIEHRGTPLAPDGRGAPSRGDWEKLPAVIDEIHAAELTPAGLVDDLSTDPSVLRDQLLKQAQCGNELGGLPDGLCLFSAVEALFTQYVVPPRLAAVMWTVLAVEPDVRSLGSVRDRVGRRGVGVSLFDKSDLDKRWVLVISPKSGQLLGAEQILLEPSKEISSTVPAIVQFTAIIAANRSHDVPSEAGAKRF